MARILITGSSDGLGLRAAKLLVARGHTVHLHARNAQRAADARTACPGAASVLVGDLASLPETRALASSIAALGQLDCVFHNAGLYLGPYRAQAEGYPSVFAVNVLAPYILTCLAPLPKRLLYASSNSHFNGSAGLEDLGWREREGEGRFNDRGVYADTKLHNVMFAYAFARRFAQRGVVANAVDPGWVPTKMGGVRAPGDILESDRLYVMLAEGSGEAEGSNAGYWEPGGLGRSREETYDVEAQDALLKRLEEITGVAVPE